jgi:hypothetical protein
VFQNWWLRRIAELKMGRNSRTNSVVGIARMMWAGHVKRMGDNRN